MKKIIGLVGLLIWISFLAIFIAPKFADDIAEKIWLSDIPSKIRNFKNDVQDFVLQTWAEDIKKWIWEWYDNLKIEAGKLKDSVWEGIDWVIDKVKTEKDNFHYIKWNLEDNLQNIQDLKEEQFNK